MDEVRFAVDVEEPFQQLAHLGALRIREQVCFNLLLGELDVALVQIRLQRIFAELHLYVQRDAFDALQHSRLAFVHGRGQVEGFLFLVETHHFDAEEFLARHVFIALGVGVVLGGLLGGGLRGAGHLDPRLVVADYVGVASASEMTYLAQHLGQFGFEAFAGLGHLERDLLDRVEALVQPVAHFIDAREASSAQLAQHFELTFEARSCRLLQKDTQLVHSPGGAKTRVQSGRAVEERRGRSFEET